MTAFDDAPLRIGTVALAVHDLEGVRRFYREVVGLDDLGGSAGSAASVRLGAGGTAFLELRREPAARARSGRDAGLFHTAFLLPRRADLGRWVRHAAETGVPLQGASDHVVSEAIYLADPEGNGVEIYADRPPSAWPWVDGFVAMRTDPLDGPGLVASAGPEPWTGVPDGAVVGHVHLQVGAIALAEAFYGGVLGLDLTARYPGASFFSSGGYHHHVAANVWNSRNTPPRTEPTTGLADFEIVVADPAVFDGIAARADAVGVAVERQGDGLAVRDPWGTSLRLVAAR